MTSYFSIDDLDVADKTVIVRVDLNVPLDDAGNVGDVTRLLRILPTLKDLVSRHAKIILISHLGRPKGKVVPELSLRPVVEALDGLVDFDVTFIPDLLGELAQGAAQSLEPGKVVVFENLRFEKGEEENSAFIAERLASYADFYINDAFSASHRSHASVVGLPKHLRSAAGRLMEAELEALSGSLESPATPVMGIVGGSKVSTKLSLLSNLMNKVDFLVIGGAMANTFLKAQGQSIGTSLVEDEMLDTARKILDESADKQCEVILPLDVVVAPSLSKNTPSKTVLLENMPEDEMILDLGERTVHHISSYLDKSKTLIWNGPLGAFEIEPFDHGTAKIAAKAAALTASGKLLSVAGGGDTVAALASSGVERGLSYISTAGGAFLEWLEGKDLPGVAALSSS